MQLWPLQLADIREAQWGRREEDEGFPGHSSPGALGPWLLLFAGVQHLEAAEPGGALKSGWHNGEKRAAIKHHPRAGLGSEIRKVCEWPGGAKQPQPMQSAELFGYHLEGFLLICASLKARLRCPITAVLLGRIGP